VIETNSLFQIKGLVLGDRKIRFYGGYIQSTEGAHSHVQYGRVLSIRSRLDFWLSQHFPMLDVQISVLCTHTHTYICSLSKFPLVVSGEYSVFFPTVHTNSLNRGINLSWR